MITGFSNVHFAYILAFVTVSSIAIFFLVWFLLNIFYYRTLGKRIFINRFVERTRRTGESPMIKKYGLVGLALLMAIPLPTIGVYGGTLLSWLMGMKFWDSLIAVMLGATVSNSIVLLSVFGIIQAVGIFG